MVYSCKLCPYCTDREWNYERHMSSVHSNNTCELPVQYNCSICNLSFASKQSMSRHISKCGGKIPVSGANVSISGANVSMDGANVSINGGNVSMDGAIVSIANSKKKHTCPKCSKEYVRKIDLEKHLYNCKGDLEVLSCCYCNKIFYHRSSKSRHQQVCEYKEKQLIHSNHANNGHGSTGYGIHRNSDTHMNGGVGMGAGGTVQNHIQTQNNIQQQNIIGTQQIIINNFGSENMEHITPQFIEKCIRNAISTGVPDMVRKLHFDPGVPENNNIRIESLRRQQLRVYQDNDWMIKDKTDVIDDMIDRVCMVMREYYHGEDGKQFKDEDETQHSRFYIYRLVEIINKMPTQYHPLRRKIFAMIMNFCKILEEVEAEEKIDTPS